MDVGGFGVFLKDWGPPGLTALAVFAVIMGWLMPRLAVEKLMNAQELRISEALEREKHYREAAERLQLTVELQAKQLGETVEQGRLIIALLQSLQSAATGGTGGRHVR